MSDTPHKRPRIEFLRKLLPVDFTEEQIQVEEDRLLRFIALVERIVLRTEFEEHARKTTQRDSTLCDQDSIL